MHFHISSCTGSAASAPDLCSRPRSRHTHGATGFKQQTFIDFLLAQYVAQVVDELAPEKLTPLLCLRYSDVLADTATNLGPPDQIRSTFVGFQRLLYEGGSSPSLGWC